MSGPRTLAEHRGRLVTRVGGAFVGTRAVFRGHDLHKQLDGVGWFELAAFGITGKRLSAPQLRIMEAIWVWTSYPDARIWNNRVAALAGSTRSTPALAMAAANAVSEAMIYGRRNEYRALSFFKRVRMQRDAGLSLSECLAHHEQVYGRIPGYGRPLATGDERIAPTMTLAAELGVADGPHVSLAFEINRYLAEQGRPLQMNYGALVSAFGADFGFTPREFNLYFFSVFLAGMQPCYLEAADKPEGALFATACTDIAYEGPRERSWAGRGEVTTSPNPASSEVG